MTPKERSDRLLKRERPKARRLEIMDGEQYSADLGVLWAAYKAGSFPDAPTDLEQTKFVSLIEELVKTHDAVWIIDEFNRAFKGGRGPVALACTRVNGLVVEAEGTAFKWASRRNCLRCAVSFINMLRHSGKTGICMVKGTPRTRAILDHLKLYNMMFFLGRSGPDEFLYSVRGRGSDG